MTSLIFFAVSTVNSLSRLAECVVQGWDEIHVKKKKKGFHQNIKTTSRATLAAFLLGSLFLCHFAFNPTIDLSINGRPL